MDSTQVETRKTDLTVIVTLARLLERLDASAEAVGAEQYRSVVRGLATELQALQNGEALQAVLRAHPSAAELYENLYYQHAGLCRSPLELALDAEIEAKQVLNRAAKTAAQSKPLG